MLKQITHHAQTHRLSARDRHHHVCGRDPVPHRDRRAFIAHSSPETTITVYIYKLQSAYILILTGLSLKIVTDLILWVTYGERAWWMRIKLACTAFLTVNAIVFLVPMMPELLALAEASVPAGELSKAFLTLESREQLVGLSNVIPLVTEMVMGAFRPKITRDARAVA